MKTFSKSGWLLLLFLLGGIVVGGLLGNLAQKFLYLDWLSFGYSFGTTQPFSLNLQIIQIQFGLSIHINIASLFGVTLALLLYRKVST